MIDLRVASILARLHKEAAKKKKVVKVADLLQLNASGEAAELAKEGMTGVQALGHGVGILGKLPKVLTKSFREAGKDVTTAAALDPSKPGLVSKILGGLVRYTPHAAATYGGAKLLEPHVAPYMRGKVRQYRARQAATRPYYDPRVGRFM
jgi:hypothetical protein